MSIRKLRHRHDDPSGKKYSDEPWSVVASRARRYWQGIQNAIARPWWVYDCGPNCRHHEGLSDLVFRFDDPIWRSLYPPNGRDCMWGVRKFTAANVEERSFDEAATYCGREVSVVGRHHAENRGYRMHRLSADRREVTPYPGWLGRPVACEPAEVYKGSRYSFEGGGMMVPPDVSLPDANPGDRSLPVATRRLAALRLDVLTGLAAILLSGGPELAAQRSPAGITSQTSQAPLGRLLGLRL